MPVFSSGSDDLMGSLDAVIGATRDFLELSAPSGQSAAVIDVIRTYYIQSDVFADGISLTISPDTDRFSPTEARARLFGVAASDLLVFRCIALVEFLAAVNESRAMTADELTQFRYALQEDLIAARRSFDRPGGTVVIGGAANQFEVFAHKKINEIAGESASNILGAALDLLGGFVPVKTPSTAARVLHRFGRTRHLDSLLDWAQRMLDLALNKLRRVFGPGFDVIIEPVKSLLNKFVGVRGQIADSIFQVPSLLAKCDREIENIQRDAQRMQACWTELGDMSERFDNWSFGLDFASGCLKWGTRISVVSPPVAVALAAVRAALAAGAFVIGRYYLDSPELDFLPWGTYGALSIIQGKNTPSNPEPIDDPRRAMIQGDPGF